MNSRLRWLVSCLSLAPQWSFGQSCDGGEVEIHNAASGVDTIAVTIHGGFPYHRTDASISADGRVLLREDRRYSGETMVAVVAAAAFNEFLDRAMRAVEALEARGPRRNPLTLEELLDTIQNGRLEPLCLRHTDGVDTDIALHLAGEKTTYSCVTGELREVGRQISDVVQVAIDDAGQPFCR